MTSTTVVPAASANNGDAAMDPARRLRQKERTIDNLNRLFAMIFSIIFSIGILSVVNKISDFLSGIAAHLDRPDLYPSVSVTTVGFNAGALIILGATAAIFFHQASRGLDLQYASSPDIVPNSLGFLVDYLVIFLQMVPFVLMAKSLESSLTHKVGFIWFFLSHEVLILFGLTLLVIQQARHIFIRREAPNPQARRISLGVQRYWFIMNSVYICLTTLAFAVLSGSFGDSQFCPTNPRIASLYFPLIFFALAMTRNWLDFSWMWNVFYPVKGLAADGSQIYRWPLPYLMNAGPDLRRFAIFWPVALGYGFLIAAAYLTFFVTRIFDLGLWSRLCAM